MTSQNTPYALPGSQTRQSITLMTRGIRNEWRIYAIAIAASGVFGLITVATSRVVGHLTSSYIIPILDGNRSVATIWAGAGILFAVIVALVISIVFRRIFAAQGTFHLQARHRRALGNKFVELPPAWHRQTSPGKLLSNVSSDSEAATSVFNPLPFMLGVVVMLIAAAVMLFSIDSWLALSAFSIIPIMIIANLFFQQKMTPAVTHAQELRGEVSEVAHESFEAATLVKAMGTEDTEAKRFDTVTDDLEKANVRAGTIRAVFDPIIDALPNIGALLVLIVGLQRVSAGAATAGDIVSAAYLMSLLAVPVRSFGWVLAELPRSVVGYQRVAQVVDTTNTVTPGTHNMTLTPGEPAEVKLADIGVSFTDEHGTQHVLQNVTLTITAGTTMVLMGRTGAGKSTLVSLIPRLADPDQGTITIADHNVAELTRTALSNSVVFVAQSTFIFEDTVRTNVTLSDSAYTDEQVWEALEAAHIADFVRTLPKGINTNLGERGSNLSGGQRQRLAIARALVRRPSVLILDDATSALDPQVEQAILATVRQNYATTVIMVAYRAASARLADEVCVLAHGNIVARGTHDQLVTTNNYYQELVMAYERDAEQRREDSNAGL